MTRVSWSPASRKPHHPEVRGDEFFVGIVEYVLQRTSFAGGLQRSIYFFHGYVAAHDRDRSTAETFGVGTRTAKPSSLPLSSGIAR